MKITLYKLEIDSKVARDKEIVVQAEADIVN